MTPEQLPEAPPPPLPAPPEPSSGTTVAAAACALLAGLLSLPLAAFVGLLAGPRPRVAAPSPLPFDVAVPAEPPLALVLGAFVAQALAALFLLLGALMLFGRKHSGRYLTAVGAVLAIVEFGLRIVQSNSAFYLMGATSVVGLALPAAAGVLVMLPATRAWIEAR